MSEKRKGLLGQLLFLAIGVGMYAYTVVSDFQIRSANDIGSGGVPKIICGIIIALSLIKIVMLVLDKSVSDKAVKNENIHYSKGIAVIGVLAIYCFAIKAIGFPILNPIMLFVEMILLAPKEKRNYLLFAILSVVVTIIVFIAFYYGLDLMLPAGLIKTLL